MTLCLAHTIPRTMYEEIARGTEIPSLSRDKSSELSETLSLNGEKHLGVPASLSLSSETLSELSASLSPNGNRPAEIPQPCFSLETALRKKIIVKN